MSEVSDPTRYLGNQQNHQRMYDFERDIIRVKTLLMLTLPLCMI